MYDLHIFKIILDKTCTFSWRQGIAYFKADHLKRYVSLIHRQHSWWHDKATFGGEGDLDDLEAMEINKTYRIDMYKHTK